ncbi:MAG TPA: ParA family protein [Allocoleopsis sp.]
MLSHPQIIVIANGKGGVGKTTTTMCLSGIFGEKLKVLAVDADSQGSFSWWTKRTQKPLGFDITTQNNPDLLGNLRKQKGYDLIIIDTPPALRSEALKTVLSIADYIILPTPPAPMDLAALIDTVEEAIASLKIPYRVLLTKVDSRSLAEALEAQNTLLELGIPVHHAFVRSFKAYEKAVLDGVPINKSRGKNAREAEADYRRVADELQRDWRK